MASAKQGVVVLFPARPPRPANRRRRRQTAGLDGKVEVSLQSQRSEGTELGGKLLQLIVLLLQLKLRILELLLQQSVGLLQRLHLSLEMAGLDIGLAEPVGSG